MKKSLFIIIVYGIFLLSAQSIYAQEIFDAIRSGDLAKVKGLVEKNPQLVKARNARQSTPLHVAVDVNNEPIARYLIEQGADLNALNGNQWTPLFFAKTAGLAELLVEKGADIDLSMPIAWMLATRRKEVADYLLDRGARVPGSGTPQGLLFLVRSLRSGSVRLLEKYLGQGFNPLHESPAKNNLLHYAAESDSGELIDRLIGLGVPSNTMNIFGWKPLHIAAANGNLRTLKSLLKRDPDVKARTPDGKTAYNLATEAKKAEVAEYLKSVGADEAPARFPELRGDYMGQPKPGTKAVPFAPGILSPRHAYHGAIAFTPDGNEMYWSAYTDGLGASIWHAKREDGRWRQPEFFSPGDVPFITPDGRKFFFVESKQVQDGNKEVICVRDRVASGWSEPKELPETVNALPRIHWQASVDKWGNLYFGASGGQGSRIYCSEFKAGEYGRPQVIAALKDIEAFSPFIAPDGSYLIISKVGENGEELVILFKKRDGTWSAGIEVSSRLGIQGAFCPIVTQDGKYFFFVASVDGTYAPFWADAGFIEELKSTAGIALPQAGEAPEKQAPKLDDRLSILKPFIGPTWLGSIPSDSRMGEITLKWEVLLNGFAVKLSRHVLKFDHWLETTYFWDESSGKIAYLAILNNGFVSKGFVAGQGEELVSEGDQGGPDVNRKVRRTYKLDKDGKLYEDDQFRNSDTDEWRRTHVSVFVAR